MILLMRDFDQNHRHRQRMLLAAALIGLGLLFVTFLTAGGQARADTTDGMTATDTAPSQAGLDKEDGEALAEASAYLSSLEDMQGDFLQVGPDGSVAEGKFYLRRPGRLRFEYEPPENLLVVADEPGIDAAADALRQNGRYVRSLQADLATLDGVDQLLEAAGDRSVDLLCANAGMGTGHAFLEQDVALWRRSIDTNITGTVYLLQRMLRPMVQRNAGKVLIEGVNVTTRHRKPTQANPQNGIDRLPAPMAISKVSLADPKDGKPTRVRFETKDGKKVRVAVKSGETIDG